MAGTAREGGTGEGVQHFNAVRLRITGTGNFKMKLFSFDDEFAEELAELPLKERNFKEPTVPTNFISQRAALEIKTTNINEYFKINRIIIFAREIFTSYPE